MCGQEDLDDDADGDEQGRALVGGGVPAAHRRGTLTLLYC
jgi:hypothetical protein